MTIQRSPVPGSMTLEEAANYLQVDKERLLQWTIGGYAPHHTVDGTGPFFTKSTIKPWLLENIVSFKGGIPIPQKFNILSSLTTEQVLNIPKSISVLPNIQSVSLASKCPGIYFLCQDGEVVYVGMSECVVYRIATHIKEGVKSFDWDKIFFIPCPVDVLEDVEKQFIIQLRPKYNGGERGLKP